MTGVSRRQLLRNSALLAGALGATHSKLSLAGALEAGHWSRQLPPPEPLLHLMNRASFGVTQQMIEEAPATAEEWLDVQLDPLAIDDSAVDAMVARDFPGYVLPYAGQYVHYMDYSSETVSAEDARDGDVGSMMGSLGEYMEDPDEPPVTGKLDVASMARDLQGATFYYQHYSRRQLKEVMVDFWSNHFNVYLWQDRQTRQYRPQEDRVAIRPNALNSFPALLEASATSPAMLAYLDGDNNRKGKPNENYARELLELHTLGIEHYHAGGEDTRPQGFYTEQDVKEVARCFTGWMINKAGMMGFNADNHDPADKTVLGVTIRGRSNQEGVQEGLEVLRLLASHPGTARHIARKLAQRFISDTPPTGVVDAIAESFQTSGGDVPSMLRRLFLSPAFAASADEKFLRPLDYLHRTLRVLDAELQLEPSLRWDWQPLTTSKAGYKFEKHYLDKEGHALFSWDTPDGYPATADHWLNPNALLQRWRMAAHLVENHWWQSFVTVDPAALVSEPASPEEIVDTLADRVLRRALLDEDRSTLIDLAATAGDGHLARVRAVLTALLGSAYFQLT